MDAKAITEGSSIPEVNTELPLCPWARHQDLALIKNTYRVLLTRGQKGCYVRYLKKDTENYFLIRIRRVDHA